MVFLVSHPPLVLVDAGHEELISNRVRTIPNLIFDFSSCYLQDFFLRLEVDRLN